MVIKSGEVLQMVLLEFLRDVLQQPALLIGMVSLVGLLALFIISCWR